MSRQISRAETYQTVHQAFAQVNLTAFDYNTIKKSLIDYLKIYYKEDFNDFIESSELIAIIETFAYVGELISYRLDMNAQENFLSTAQRKESILRLAKLISYKPFRNIPHRGMVKINTVSTTEEVLDIDGINLANTIIRWNDNNNSKWKDQFILVMNRILQQRFGSVGADSRAQVDNVLFELYTLKNANRARNRTIQYTANVSDTSFNMELVPVELHNDGPVERRPENNTPFTLMYASDGLGDASDTTGFLLFTKQGVLQRREVFFDGITPNQTYTIDVPNINHTDIYINNVDPDTRELLVNDPLSNLFNSSDSRYGEWVEVGDENYESVIFNIEKNRRKFQVETLDNDQVKIIFGDGEFADIPSGAFDIWFRTSANDAITIPKSAISEEEASFVYVDNAGKTQTFTFTFTLVSALQNASETESLEHIRNVAPSVYYTQDRMVNARDYNTYMLQDPRILKLKGINRTFAGDSKYIAWHDPKDYYEDTKIFGNDLAIFRKKETPINGLTISVNRPITPSDLIENELEPLLSSVDYFLTVVSQLEVLTPNNLAYRKNFYSNDLRDEKEAIRESLVNAKDGTNSTGTIGKTVSLYYSVFDDSWYVNNPVPGATLIFQINPEYASGGDHSGWTIRQATDSFVAYSGSTKFWNENGPDTRLNLNSLLAEKDTLTILGANTTADGKGIMGSDIKFNVIKQESLNDDFDTINSLNIIPFDVNNDEVPDNLAQPEIFGNFENYAREEITDSNNKFFGSPTLLNINGNNYVMEVANPYLQGFENEDVEVYVNRSGGTVERLLFGIGWTTPALGNPSNVNPGTIIRSWVQIMSSVTQPGDVYSIRSKRYVYLRRNTINEPWEVVGDNESTKLLFFQESTSAENQRLYTRYEGRYPMNFSWFHSTPRLHLIDPAPSNIIDIFVITDAYYRDYSAYLNEVISFAPQPPSSYQLTQTFKELISSKMISDTVVMHSGKLRPLFGSKASNEDRAKIKIILSSQNIFSENDIKNKVINVIRNFFSISNWNFGETFYFSEMSAAIHAQLSANIQSVVLVPESNGKQFGDLYEIKAREDEIFLPDIASENIEIIQNLNPQSLRQ